MTNDHTLSSFLDFELQLAVYLYFFTYAEFSQTNSILNLICAIGLSFFIKLVSFYRLSQRFKAFMFLPVHLISLSGISDSFQKWLKSLKITVYDVSGSLGETDKHL